METENTGMIELTVSGSYRTIAGTDKDRQQFSGIKLVVPRCRDGLKEDKIDTYTSFAVRCFPIARQADKALSKINYEGIIKIFVDDVKPVAGVPLCVGKDVKQMSIEELQHMACCLLLREIPQIHSGNIRTAREKAYITYMKVIKKKKIVKTDGDVKKIEEEIRRQFERAGLTKEELEEKVEEALKDTFDMRVNIHNPELSYNFAKLKPLIAVKEWKENASETE